MATVTDRGMAETLPPAQADRPAWGALAKRAYLARRMSESDRSAFAGAYADAFKAAGAHWNRPTNWSGDILATAWAHFGPPAGTVEPTDDDASKTAPPTVTPPVVTAQPVAPVAPVSGDTVTEIHRALGIDPASIAARVLSVVQPRIDAIASKADAYRGVEVINHATGESRKIEGLVHPIFDEVRALLDVPSSDRFPVMLVGPAGCGKTHLAAQVAHALGVPFYGLSVSGGTSEADLRGRLLPIGERARFEYVVSTFVKAYSEGGLFLADEMDGADANVLLVLNSALANGHMTVPQRHDNPVVTKHDNFRFLGACNTYCNGADRVYVGRNQQDGAAIDRFITLEMDYDPALEERLISPKVLAWGRKVREAVTGAKLRRIVSTRGFQRVDTCLKAGQSWSRAKAVFFAGWTTDEMAKIPAECRA